MDYPYGNIQAVNCDNTTVKSTYWFTPVTGKGVHSGYKLVLINAETEKPRPDAVKVVHVKHDQTQEDLYIALQDTGSSDDFNSRCNACCDDVTAMPAVTVPEVIIEETACPDEDDNRNFFTITRALVAGEIYDFSASIDGEALTPATQDEGFATLAAFETWADTNWAPNTFAVSGTKVTMTSATAETGSLHAIIKKYYESNAPAALDPGEHYELAATVNGVALTPIVGADDAALTTIATTANATAAYAALGKWSVVGGKIRLVSSVANSASLVVTVA